MAKIVASMAINPTLSMIEPSTGPRSERRPTSARVISDWAISVANPAALPTIPRKYELSR